MAVRKRSVSISGHATSFSLEDEFWHALKALAVRRAMATASLVREIDADRPRDANLSSAIRVYLLKAAQRGELPGSEQRPSR